MPTRNTPDLRTISGFKNKLTGGGTRPNLFEVVLNFPTIVTQPDAEKTRFLVKAAALPASTIAPVEVPFRGRIFKIAGDRTFETWTVTVINDTDFEIRNAFEEWMNVVNQLDNATGITNPDEYMQDALVHQLDRSAGEGILTAAQTSVLRSYQFRDIFPTNISAIDLSYDSTDAIEEFTVEFQVQWWEAIKGGATVASNTSDIS